MSPPVSAHSPLNRKTAFIDLLSVVAVLVVVKQAVLPHSLAFAGPASTFSAMAVASYLLWRRGLGWGDLGFRWPANWWGTLGWTVVIFVAFLAVTGLSSEAVDLWFDDIGAGGDLISCVGISPLICWSWRWCGRMDHSLKNCCSALS